MYLRIFLVDIFQFFPVVRVLPFSVRAHCAPITMLENRAVIMLVAWLCSAGAGLGFTGGSPSLRASGNGGWGLGRDAVGRCAVRRRAAQSGGHRHQMVDRRTAAAQAGLLAGAALCGAHPVLAAARRPPLAGNLNGGGGRLDRQPDPSTDVIHPASLLGEWICQRKVTLVEGNAEQAELVWLALGGSEGGVFDGRQVETFSTRFIVPPPSIQSAYEFEGQTLKGVVLDRGFEIKSRARGAARVVWSPQNPAAVSFERSAPAGATGSVQLTVVQRSIELPSDKGWGGDELVRLVTEAGGLAGGLEVQVQRLPTFSVASPAVQHFVRRGGGWR